MTERSSWTGSAADLLRVSIERTAQNISTAGIGWPKNPRSLAGRLRRAQTFLRQSALRLLLVVRGERKSGHHDTFVSRQTVGTVSTVSSVSGTEKRPNLRLYVLPHRYGRGCRASAEAQDDADGADVKAAFNQRNKKALVCSCPHRLTMRHGRLPDQPFNAPRGCTWLYTSAAQKVTRLGSSPEGMLSCLSQPYGLFSNGPSSCACLRLNVLYLLGHPHPGGIENEFIFLPITFVLSGIILQAILLRRFRLSQRRQLHFPFVRRKTPAVLETKVCRYCNRAISADARICRFCLTEVDGHPASSAKIASQTQIQNSQLQNERWRASPNAKFSI